MREFATSLRKNGIFVKPEIKADMDKMLKLISDAVFERRMNDEDGTLPRLRDEYKKFKSEAQPLLDSIEAAVASRLWDLTTAEV